MGMGMQLSRVGNWHGNEHCYIWERERMGIKYLFLQTAILRDAVE